jgi:hypothetical protein
VEHLTLKSLLGFGSPEAVYQRLVDFIQASYMDVARKLNGEIRLFAATNAGVFLLMLLLSFLRPQSLYLARAAGSSNLRSGPFC